MPNMAYQKTRTEGYQTSTNVAAELTAALVAQGAVEATASAVIGTVREIRDALFSDIIVITDADNAMLQAEAAKAPASTSGESRRATSADGNGKGSHTFTKDEGLALSMNFGKFKGMTVGDILNLSASEAEKYGYTTGPGRTWVEWLAQDEEPKRDYAKRAAVAALS
jgi:hypothetical protein